MASASRWAREIFKFNEAERDLLTRAVVEARRAAGCR